MVKQSIVFIISVLSFWLGTENVLAVADKKKGQNDVVHAHRLPLTLKNFNPDTARYVRANGILKLKTDTLPSLGEDVSLSDTMFYSPAFLPVVFDGKVLPHNLDLRPNLLKNKLIADRYMLIDSLKTLAPQLASARRNAEVRRAYYLSYPQLVRYNEQDFKTIENNYKPQMLTPNQVSMGIVGSVQDDFDRTLKVERFELKRIYWTKSGEHSLQINQNQFSDNWHTGGNNNFSMINYHKLQLNYAKNKLTWNNTLEWKLSFLRTPVDTLHQYSIIEDFFRYYTVLGLKISPKWSYSMTNEAKTALFNSYRTNSTKRRSALLSPLYVNSGIGLSYSHAHTSKKNKYRKFSVSLNLSPISVNYTYVGDDLVDETNFGIERGKNSKLDLGSTYNANLSYTHGRSSSFTSRFKYFTSYSRVIVESENRFNFAFTRLLSTSLYLYLRYDDGVAISKKDDKLGYFQYNEVVGLGINYRW